MGGRWRRRREVSLGVGMRCGGVNTDGSPRGCSAGECRQLGWVTLWLLAVTWGGHGRGWSICPAQHTHCMSTAQERPRARGSRATVNRAWLRSLTREKERGRAMVNYGTPSATGEPHSKSTQLGREGRKYNDPSGGLSQALRCFDFVRSQAAPVDEQ